MQTLILTVIKWATLLNHEGPDYPPATGIKYRVKYNPETGIDPESIEAFAIQHKSSHEIDITLSLIHDHQLDLFIESVADWKKEYNNKLEDIAEDRIDFFSRAKQIVLEDAKRYSKANY
jgi:hypothetical protein